MSRSFELKEFKSGAARMARDARVPLLPTTLWGAHRVWTKDAPKHRGRSRIPIFVEIGEPIVVERGSNVEEATARLKAAMQEPTFAICRPGSAARLPPWRRPPRPTCTT